MKRVFVVDDSALMRKLMCDIINSIQGYEVVDVCADGENAYRRISDFGNFDVITMNVNLPRMSGIDVIKKLVDSGCRIPIIAISTTVKEDRDMTMKACDDGAVEFVVRPFHLSPEERETFTKELKKALQAAGSSKLVKPQTLRPADAVKPMAPVPPVESPKQENINRAVSSMKATDKFDLVAIASSTGGPQALRTCIPMLPKGLKVPVIITQHMPKGFTASLAERINETANLEVCEASDREVLQNDHVYIAPGGKHLEIKMNPSGKMMCSLSDAPAIGNLKPCADVMYRSLGSLPIKNILCVVLTGMGSDGTEGISYLSSVKNVYCITQSADTCVVYGMPKSADVAGLSNESAPINEMAKAIAKKLGV